MEYRLLGKSGLRVSVIGFGCMSLGEDESVNSQILLRATELGINFFDTADLYQQGRNESMVGKILKGKRNNLVLATKVGNQIKPDGSGWDWNPTKQYILGAVEKSLQRLGTDYIDLYQLHGGTIDDPISESIEAFEILKSQGKIRHYGISSIRPNVIREYLQRSSITSVMLQYNLLDRRPEEDLLQILPRYGIGVLARGSLAQGFLVNKPAKEYLGYEASQVAELNRAVHTLSGAGRSPAQTALRFVLQHQAITASVTGIRTLQQLEEVATTTDTPELTPAEMTSLSHLYPPNKYAQHR